MKSFEKISSLPKHKMLMASGIACLALLGACTKDIPYKQVLKEEIQNKAQIDTMSDYLYTSSMMNASRSSADALPYSASENKRVKLEWTKTSLRVIEVEKDARFQGNETNNKLVLDIPVEYVDFQCAKDKYGECTGTEEEAKDITWNQKGKFKFKLEAAKSGTLDLLPILIDKAFGGNCYEEIGSKVLKTEVEDNAINLEIERTFKTTCGDIQDTSDSSISAVYHYSMAKISSITSKDFKPISYPSTDERTFGFFSTTHTKLAADNSEMISSKTTLMNHWNPNRSEIVYYLSDDFAKPENAMIKDLTYKTIENLNAGLKISDVKFRIKLQEPAHKSPGDIRNSMIVLVEDPVASSIIGYGPQTEDPVTGEIVSARTVMFLGTIKGYVREIYNNILNEKKKQQLVSKTLKPVGAGNAQDNGGLIIENGMRSKIQSQIRLNQKLRASLKSNVSTVNPMGLGQAGLGKSTGSKSIERELKSAFQRANVSNDGSPQARYKYLQESKNCSMGLNADLPIGSISPRLASQFPDDAKAWELLSDDEINHAMAIILPEVWVPTLIHELGHNLGLRHNFEGSQDKANFYSSKELQDLGIDHQIPFSTVMEYGDDLKALPVLGKYDIAALRFGYLRKVQLGSESNSEVDVPDTLDVMVKADQKAKSTRKDGPLLKTYGYCTDENLGSSPKCRQFDIGTSLTEVVQNDIRGYLDQYKNRNFRHGKLNMSLFDDLTYARRVRSRFMELRQIQNSYQFLKNKFGFKDSDAELAATFSGEDLAFLTDMRDASLLAGQFLLNVLKTPDLTCAIAKRSKPQEIVQVLPLGQAETSCFKIEKLDSKNEFMVVGQYGKSFLPIKDPKSDNSFADQIDVRGYWIDKLMAARALFQRQAGGGRVNSFSDNFADREAIQPELFSTLMQVMLNEVSDPQEIQMIDGSIQTMPLPVDIFNTHTLNTPLTPSFAKAFGIPNESVNFTQILASEVKRDMLDANHMASGKFLYDAVSVSRAPVTGFIEKGFQYMDLGTDRLIATPNNVIAFAALSRRQLVSFLDTLKKDKVQAILTEKLALEKDKKPLPDLKQLPNEEQIAWGISSDDLDTYVKGGFAPPIFYQNLLLTMPN